MNRAARSALAPLALLLALNAGCSKESKECDVGTVLVGVSCAGAPFDKAKLIVTRGSDKKVRDFLFDLDCTRVTRTKIEIADYEPKSGWVFELQGLVSDRPEGELYKQDVVLSPGCTTISVVLNPAISQDAGVPDSNGNTVPPCQDGGDNCPMGCTVGQKNCNGNCIAEDQCCTTDDCRAAPEHGSAVCVGATRTCGFTCENKYVQCNQNCVLGSCCIDSDCPAGQEHTKATCNDQHQCEYPCEGDFKSCGSVCVSKTVECCANSDCKPVSGKVTACDTATYSCNESCSATSKPCRLQCIATTDCCSDGDCVGGKAGEVGQCKSGSCAYACRPGFTTCPDKRCVPEGWCCGDTSCTNGGAFEMGTCNIATGACTYGCSLGNRRCNSTSACVPPTWCCSSANCEGAKVNEVPSCDTGTGGCTYNCSPEHKRCASGNACVAKDYCCSSADCPVSSSLVAYWPFDGDTMDKSGKGNHGTFVKGAVENSPASPAVFAAGKKGQALSLANPPATTEPQWVRVPNSSSINQIAVSGAFSITVWVKGGQYDLDFNTIISRHMPGTAAHHFVLGVVQEFPASAIILVNPFRFYGPLAADKAPSGVWYHLGTTYDGRKLSLYVNGALAATLDVNLKVVADTTNVIIGAKQNIDVVKESWDGSIDELRFYSSALTPLQISADMTR